MICETESEIYRAESFFDKEPETIAWIDAFEAGKFADVGANIGVYSLYCAAKHPDVVVLAFEPQLENFNRLLKNIEINGFHNIVPMHFALGDAVKETRFYVKKNESGSSGGQIEKPIDEYGAYFEPDGVEAVPQFTLNMWPDVHYIKIDVDGHEGDVLCGSGVTLSNPFFRSMLIECNRSCIDIDWLITEMKLRGIDLDDRFNGMKPHSRDRRGGDPENLVFTRA